MARMASRAALAWMFATGPSTIDGIGRRYPLTTVYVAFALVTAMLLAVMA
jgi:hypothetical protein